jgi:hypothetical protein
MTPSKYPQRRLVLLSFVQPYIAEHGFTPTPTTLSRLLGWPQSACTGYLQRLRLELPLPTTRPSKPTSYLFHRQPLLDLIKTYTAQKGFPPTLRDLASETGLSPTTLSKYLRCMRAEGLVDYAPGITRSMRVK